MKVYLAYMRDYDEFTLYGVFSDKKVAEELMPYATIVEMNVDGNIDYMKNKMIPWHVFENQYKPKDEDGPAVEVGYGRSDFYETGNNISKYDSKHYNGYVWAKDKEEAIKKFKELRKNAK